AFYRSRQGRLFPVGGDETLVRLRPGTNLGDFTRRASELARRYPSTQGVQVINLADQQAKVEQAIRPQADALALFAALAGLAVLPVLVIAPVAWQAAQACSRRGSGQPASAGSSRLAGLGGAPAAAIGVRMAFEPGRGRSAVPVRSALTGTAVAVAAVVAAMV